MTVNKILKQVQDDSVCFGWQCVSAIDIVCCHAELDSASHNTYWWDSETSSGLMYRKFVKNNFISYLGLSNKSE